MKIMQFNPSQTKQIEALTVKAAEAGRYEQSKLAAQLSELLTKFTAENLQVEQHKAKLKAKHLKRFNRNAK